MRFKQRTMKKETIGLITGCITFGVSIGIVIASNFIFVEKKIVVTFDEKMETVNFKSNHNRNGDTYLIIRGNDTLSTGTVRNGVWE
jgi:hypothetical protein